MMFGLASRMKTFESFSELWLDSFCAVLSGKNSASNIGIGRVALVHVRASIASSPLLPPLLLGFAVMSADWSFSSSLSPCIGVTQRALTEVSKMQQSDREICHLS